MFRFVSPRATLGVLLERSTPYDVGLSHNLPEETVMSAQTKFLLPLSPRDS